MENNCPDGGTGYCGDGRCPHWHNGECAPDGKPVCKRCHGKGVIEFDTFKDMGLNRAERRRRIHDSQRFKMIPCPECK